MTNTATLTQNLENQLTNLVSNIESFKANMSEQRGWDYVAMNAKELRGVEAYKNNVRASFATKVEEFVTSIKGDFIQEKNIIEYAGGTDLFINLVVYTNVDGKIVRNSLNVPNGAIKATHYRIQNKVVKSIK